MEVTLSSASSSSASAQPIDKSMQNAIREFQSILTDKQRRQLHETGAVPEADSILRFTAELDSRDKDRRGPSIASRLYRVLLSVRDFCSIIDTFVSSHPEIAALVWGSVKLSMQQLQAQERKEASESRRKLSTFFSRHDSRVDQIRKRQIEKNERQILGSGKTIATLMTRSL
ncbi:hypothetical protein DL765_011643 [Monosporascus sp. GIB2]|nr:hypothetical protein DL765_011643 [Monosporascus sp. GIB2]